MYIYCMYVTIVVLANTALSMQIHKKCSLSSHVHLDKTPSDVALYNVLEIVPEWNGLVIKLGVPISKVHALQSDLMGGLLALQYWRDGKSGELYPSTWKFLLDTVEEVKGPEVAQKILKKVEQNETSWCAS